MIFERQVRPTTGMTTTAVILEKHLHFRKRHHRRIGHIAHGTYIAGFDPLSGYALRRARLAPDARGSCYNASLPDARLAGQLAAPLGRWRAPSLTLRLALTAMAARDVRDPWWVPAAA